MLFGGMDSALMTANNGICMLGAVDVVFAIGFGNTDYVTVCNAYGTCNSGCYVDAP